MGYRHGGNVTRAARLYGLDPDLVIDFSANINPLGPPQAALLAMASELLRVKRYPDPDCTEMREALGQCLSLDPANLVVGNGASELIGLIVNVLRPRRAGILAPTFSEYQRALEVLGSEVALFPLLREDGFLPDIDRLCHWIDGLDMLFVCNPNNPSGSLLGREEVLRVLGAAMERGTFLVIDEAFMDFIDDGDKVTLRQHAPNRDMLFVLGSLTKFFALPGIRAGYGIGSSPLIERLWKAKDPWSVNALAQVASVAALGDRDFIEKTIEWHRSERAFLQGALGGIPGLRVFPSAANYILADLRGVGLTAIGLCDLLGPKGILVRDCGNYPFLNEYYVRFAVRTREENCVLMAALEEAVLGPSASLSPSPGRCGTVRGR